MPAAKRARLQPRLESALACVRALRVVSAPPAPPAPPLLGTHDGHFHCDEALACAMLSMLPAFASHALLRTRDAEALATCEVLVDVGGIYDPPSRRYDHHQRGFGETLAEAGRSIKLSSAGLVWRHHGMELLARLAQPEALPEAELRVLYTKVYTDFVEHIDGIDNGVDAGLGGAAYAVGSSLPARVGALNPAWNEDATAEEVNERFKEAMELAVRACGRRRAARARAARLTIARPLTCTRCSAGQRAGLVRAAAVHRVVARALARRRGARRLRGRGRRARRRAGRPRAPAAAAAGRRRLPVAGAPPGPRGGARRG